MTISPSSSWASSYEKKWNDVFSKINDPGFNPNTAVAQAWGEWCEENVKSIQCIAPLAAPVTISGTPSAASFSPVIFPMPGTPITAATVLSTAFAAFASSIVWPVIPPAPPFSAIFSVITSPASVAAAQASLLAGLTAELAIIPPPGGEQAKYTAIGTLFFTAAMSLQVMFTGLAMPPPPVPPPLILFSPVM